MPFKDYLYKYDQTILKVFGYGDNKKIKLITMNCLRTSGVEDDKQFEDNSIDSIRGTVNENKLEESISRAKNKIFELAFCNPWQYFFTGTLNKDNYDRTDLDKYHKDLTKWFSNQGIKFKTKISYLLIPELHDDKKTWHIHGFVSGIPFDQLHKYEFGDEMSKSIASKLKKGEVVYTWYAYQHKFGFCSFELIRNYEAISKYITKYINKGLATSVTKLNAHLYYHSRGLKEAEHIKTGLLTSSVKPTYQSDYCSIAWLDYSDEYLEYLKSQFL